MAKKRKKNKKNSSETKKEKLKKIETKIQELKNKYEALPFDNNLRQDIFDVTQKINKIESRIIFAPLEVSPSELENLNTLKEKRSKLEQKEESLINNIRQLEEELKKIGEERIKVLIGPEIMEDIKSRHLHHDKIEQDLNIERKGNVFINKIVTNIESEIKRIRIYKPDLDRKDVASCIEKELSSYKDLISSIKPLLHIDKKQYFKMMCPLIEIVKVNGWSWESLYDAATK